VFFYFLHVPRIFKCDFQTRALWISTMQLTCWWSNLTLSSFIRYWAILLWSPCKSLFDA
jgi:hypothetical protein